MTILDKIISRTRDDLQQARQRVPEAVLRDRAEHAGRGRDFAAALRRAPEGPPRVIAELKCASPSRGVIRDRLEVTALSRELAAAGAAALSILTEVHYFRGSPAYLQRARAAVDIPLLRKDFIVTAYQLYEARSLGADAALLIAAALDVPEFVALHREAERIGLAVLAEVHNRDELRTVLDAGARIVGINSRDLHTFNTNLRTTETLLAEIPPGVIAVAESGVRSPEDMTRLAGAGAQAFLIGETLMRAPAPGARLRELLETCGIVEERR